MASELDWCPTRRLVSVLEGQQADVQRADGQRPEGMGSTHGVPGRSPGPRWLAATASVSAGSGRRQRLARAYGACRERRHSLRPCVLGTTWERFSR